MMYHANYPGIMPKLLKKNNCEFLDTSKIIVASELDGVHPDVGEHIKLGKAVQKKIKDIME